MPRTKAFNEEQVLEKALILFWRQGFQATSMQDLVEHLGINRASMYSSFGSKRDLFEKAFDTYRKRNMNQVKAYLESVPSIREGLKSMLLQGSTDTFDDGKIKGCMVVNCTSEFLPNDHEMFKVLSANKQQFEKLMVNHFGNGKSERRVPPGPRLLRHCRYF
ncbi:MAG: TetR/AcrR family transcriptional regulator [Bacteroidia bacterium]